MIEHDSMEEKKNWERQMGYLSNYFLKPSPHLHSLLEVYKSYTILLKIRKGEIEKGLLLQI